MEQRPLRLGDIVDDYCPRERRITNHAIVALVEDAIRQTRCVACDAEHLYNGGREPKRRKKDAPAAVLVEAAAIAVPPPETPPVRLASNGHGPTLTSASRERDAERERAEQAAAPVSHNNPVSNNSNDAPPPEPAETDQTRDEVWVTHRPLIRATLPRVEGDVPARPIPEFTMHQRTFGRGGGRGFGGQGWSGQGNGFRPNRGQGGQGPVDGNVRNGNGSGHPGRHHGKNRRPR